MASFFSKWFINPKPQEENGVPLATILARAAAKEATDAAEKSKETIAAATKAVEEAKQAVATQLEQAMLAMAEETARARAATEQVVNRINEAMAQTQQAVEAASVDQHLNLRIETPPLTVNPNSVDKIHRLKERCDRLRAALDAEPDMSDIRRQALQSELDAKTNALKG